MAARTASHVTQLHMTHASQLHACVGRRFKQVQHAFIYSLVQKLMDVNEEEEDDNEQECLIDFDTSMRVIHFLSTFAIFKLYILGDVVRMETESYIRSYPIIG
jgi:hypothetical protein